jgi:cytochrome c
MDYWERNLRFKTDSSEIGPVKGAPAIIGAGMAGDRASVIFSAPEEISGWIKQGC